VFWCQRELGKDLNDSDLFFKLPSMPFVFILNVGFWYLFWGFVGYDLQAPTLACGFTPIL